jgi:ABC-type polysaccharide/polyol phosphate transport system ATPase subunit
MDHFISVNGISLKFRLYHDKRGTLKQSFASLFRKGAARHYTDFWALRKIDLRIVDGDRLGIIGPNGAGKSSLLKTICRIYTPAAGEVRIRGTIAPLLEVGAGFHPELTGRENILLNGIILGQHPARMAELEEEIIGFSGLEEFIDTPVKYYSTGMYMKLAFTVATSIRADILVLDEMFAGGDAAFIERGMERLRRLIDEARIIVCVSHQLHFLESLCNRVVLMEHGEIVADGAPGQVIQLYRERTRPSRDS